ncbi:MAG: GIN domain-containing protein [Chitinophagaceae bacterium]
MKKILIITSLIVGLNATAQKVYNNFKDFDKVVLNNINGSVVIETGKEHKIEVDGVPEDDSIINIEETRENRLIISMKKGLGWEYTKNLNLKIKITMPGISKLYNNGNGNVTITNLVTRYLGVENDGNGDITLNGTIIDLLEIENSGNGDVKAKQIEAKKVNATKQGNGNIEIKTNANFDTKLSGNGNIINYGNGKAMILKQTGNGQVIYKN